MSKNIISARRIKQIVAAPAIVTLISCGSSSSPPSTSAQGPFVAPTDAQTLQAALTTSPSLEQSSMFWECVFNDANNTTLRYQLVDGGRGLETNAATPSRQSSFSWQTLSATSMSTQVDGQSTALNFTDIQFVDRNSVRMSVASENLTLQCQRRGEMVPTSPAPPQGNSINYDGTVYPLTHAIEIKFDPKDSHLGADFRFANADYRIVPVPLGNGFLNLWSPAGATVRLRADVHHPGREPFRSAEFRHVPDSVEAGDAEVAGVAYFNDATVGLDFNGDGSVEADDNEFIDVIGGSITITRLDSGGARVSLNFTLMNGAVVTGFYEGLILERTTDG